MDPQAERKKLINKQQNELKAMEKDVKKKKGFLKEEAQKKMEELQAKFEKDLADFDAEHGTSEASAKESAKEKDKAPLKVFESQDFATMSRSELDEECTLRGISKKGSKEQLVTRLVIFTQENLLAAKQQKEAQEKEAKAAPKAAAAKPAPVVVKPAAAKPAPKKKEESESEEDESDVDSVEEMTEEDKAQAERFAKREQVVQKSLYKLLQKEPKGISVEEVAEKLAEMGVKNFRPDVVGYKTLHEFFDSQPEVLLRYEADAHMIFPGSHPAIASKPTVPQHCSAHMLFPVVKSLKMSGLAA
eukprot:Phypoly_transcript_02075.p2 GENE.Phypoly_transcript_02075~~Phypoly_transcript_02075.p2  ORF type:complete len:302 (-),score=108.83 Phypoly_transcript_02075:2012-2917(-)